MTEQPIIALQTLPASHLSRLQAFIPELIAERRKRTRQRFWDWLQIDDARYFIKTTQLDSTAAKLRVSLGLRRRSGARDWPIAELRNCRKVNLRTQTAPKLLGYSKVRNTIGLVSEVVLIHEDLTEHINGPQWVKRYQPELTRLIPRLIDCILELNRLHIHHLDLWLGNFMLTDSPEPRVRVIDFENCFLRPTKYLPETLGYQLGILYEYELHKHMNEVEYDRLTQAAAASLTAVERQRFERFYGYYKHHGAGRKERYLIPKLGQHVGGKKSLR